MSANPPVEVLCQIDSLEPISGRLRGDAGRTEDFRGWMDFAAALVAVATGTDPSNQVEPQEAPRKEN